MKNTIKKFWRLLTDKDYRTLVFASRGKYDGMSDEEYLKRIYAATMGTELNLENPRGFNEKLQWLKLNNRKDEYTVMVDKYLVRDYIADVLGEEYLIPLIGVWDRAEDVDFDALPGQFAMKCNHNSGVGMCICRDKSKLDIEKVRAGLREGLEEDYYLKWREWPYKNVQRKIICEKYMLDPKTGTLDDYKFFCFDGKVDCVMVCIDRAIGDTKFYFFDREWNLLRLNKRGKEAPEGFTIPKPDNMDEMFDIAARLSAGLPYARIDLYSVAGRTYFGEITFFPDSGFDKNILPEADERWGSLIDITSIKENK